MPPKSVDDLLEDGIEIPDDPLEIEALLEGDDPQKSDLDDPGKPADVPNEGKKDAGTEGKDDPPKEGEPDHEPGPPKAVLRQARENLHRAEALLSEREQELQEERRKRAEIERELEQLRAQATASKDELQAQADRISDGRAGDLGLLDPKKLEALRADLDDDVVDLLAKLVERHNTVEQQLERLRQENEELVRQRELTAAEQQQADIDSVPILSILFETRSKEADELWQRAIAYEKALTQDPDWQDKSQREIYAEVGRRLEAFIGPDGVKKWLGEDAASGPASRDQIVKDKLERARDRSSPNSLSDLPAGAAAAQSELERLEAMSNFDLEEAYERALAKGEDAANEFLARMSMQ